MIKNKRPIEKSEGKLSKEFLKEAEGIRKELCKIEGINTAIIANTEGELLCTGTPDFAEAVAEFMKVAEVTAYNMDAESPDEIILNSSSERIIVTRVISKILLAVRTQPEANQQLVSNEIRRAAEKIKEAMKQKK